MTRKSIRETSGLSQRALAKQLGVSRSTVQRYEYGQSDNPILSKYYSKLERKSIRAERQIARREFGFTQQQIAEATKTSRSKVQRYEYGQTENKAIDEFYDRLADNMDLIQEYRDVSSEARRRKTELEDKGYTKMGAYKWLEDRGGIPKEIDLFGLNRAAVKRQIGHLRRYIGMKTSDAAGYEQVRNEARKRGMAVSGAATIDEDDAWWDTYTHIMNDPYKSKYWRGTTFLSEQLQKDLREELKRIKYEGGEWNEREVKKALGLLEGDE